MKGLPASPPINKYVSAWIVVTSVAATENYPITWRFTARLLCARGHPSTATAAIHLTGPDKFFTQPFFRPRLVIPPRIACVHLTVASSPSFLCVHLFYFHFSRQWMSRWIIEMITRTSDGFKKKKHTKDDMPSRLFIFYSHKRTKRYQLLFLFQSFHCWCPGCLSCI